LLIGLSRISEIVIAVIALLAGMINLKDFWFYGRGVSLSIPDAAKPDIYARMRRILQAKNLTGALIAQWCWLFWCRLSSFMCTSGFQRCIPDSNFATAGQHELLQLFATL